MQGEQWEIFGKVASFALPALVALAAAVGFFAAQTYEQGATVFMESAKSPDTSATLKRLEDVRDLLQQGQ